MKIASVLLLLMLFFCGCSKSAWETVNDLDQSLAVSKWPKHTYEIDVDLPDELSLIYEEDDYCLYTDDCGNFEVETRTFLASSMESAVEILSGFEPEKLSILRMDADNMMQYRFSWVTNGEGEACIHTAKLLMSESDCYAVVCTTNENRGFEYQDEIRQVFSTCELVSDVLV